MSKTTNDDHVIRLTPCQSEVFNSKARFRVLVAGRRFGKTYLALAEMVQTGLIKCNSLIWYIGPNDRQSKRVVWKRLKAMTKLHWAQPPHETELRIELTSGSTIVVNGAFHPNSLRGNGLDLVVFDEYAAIKEDTWSEVIRPALADRKGRALFISTPNGRNHLYDRFEYAKNDPDWEAFHFTTEQGGLVDSRELESAARELDPHSYRQEFEAEFINTNRNRVYYTFERALHVRELTFEPIHDLIWSIDFNVNPMCMLLIQRIKDTVIVFDEIILAQANTESACRAFLDRLSPLYRQVPSHLRPLDIHIYGDTSGRQHRTSGTDTDWEIIRRAMNQWKGDYQAFFHITRSNPPVRDRVNCVNTCLRNHADDVCLAIDNRCVELIKDLDQVAWSTDSSGAATSEIDKSDKARTHASDALGYYIAQAFPLKPKIGHNPSGRIV